MVVKEEGERSMAEDQEGPLYTHPGLYGINTFG